MQTQKFFLNYINFLIYYNDASLNKKNDIMSSKYDIFDIFRNLLMTKHNNYAIFKNNETLELLEFFKIYKKSNTEGEFTNMTLSNDFKQLFDFEVRPIMQSILAG